VDPPHAPAVCLDALHLRVRPDPRASGVGARHVGDQHRLLGVVAAAQDAVARLYAGLAVVLRHQARPAERLGPAPDDPVQGVDLVLADRLDLEAGLDPLEGGLEGRRRELGQRVLVAPERQDRVGGAEAVAEVVHRGAADAAALEDGDPAVGGLPHARLLEQARQHLVLALREVAAGPVRAGLEHDDVAPARRELRGRHRAARAGADHAHLGAQRFVGVERAGGADHRAVSPRRSRGPW
jgi:hypothetical protein